MKIFLAITLLFTVFVPSQTQSAKQREKLVDAVNQIRKDIGKKLGFGRPSEVRWDNQLAAIAKQAPDDCDQMKHGAGYRMFFLNGNRDGHKLMKFHHDTLDKLLNPYQSKIACTGKTCTSTVDQGMAKAAGLSGTRVEFRTICAVGPSESWGMNDLQRLLEKPDVVKEATHELAPVTESDSSNDKQTEDGIKAIEAPMGPSVVPSPTNNSRLAFSTSALLLALFSIMNWFL